MDFVDLLKLIGMEKEHTKYEYGCLMLYLPDSISSFWEVWKEMIDEEDLSGDGFESEPHITVQYGFDIKVRSKEVFSRLKLFPCSVKFKNFSLFENDEYDVLKIDIVSSDLRKLNKAVNDKFEITTSYPDYHPHATVAYLKKGKGKDYLAKLNNPLDDKEVVANLFVYTNDEEKVSFYAFDNDAFYK